MSQPRSLIHPAHPIKQAPTTISGIHTNNILLFQVQIPDVSHGHVVLGCRPHLNLSPLYDFFTMVLGTLEDKFAFTLFS